MNYTDEQLKRAERFFLEEWAKHKGGNICLCDNPRLFWAKATEMKCGKCKGFVRLEITRSMIKKLVEGRNFKTVYFKALINVLGWNNEKLTDMIEEEIITLIFSTTNDLIMAFWRAYGEA